MGKNDYINNRDFYDAMVLYRKAINVAKRNHEPKPQLPDYIAECIMKIASRLAMRPEFVNYIFRDDMVGDAIENVIMYIDNFDTKQSNNPFAYITQICFHAFLRRIHREKKHLYIRNKCLIQSAVMNEMYTTGEFDEAAATNPGMLEFVNDKVTDFIKTFEEKEGINNKKRKKKK